MYALRLYMCSAFVMPSSTLRHTVHDICIIYTHTCMICMHSCMMCACEHIYIYIYIYICMYVCMYIYIHTHIPFEECVLFVQYKRINTHTHSIHTWKLETYAHHQLLGRYVSHLNMYVCYVCMHVHAQFMNSGICVCMHEYYDMYVCMHACIL